MLISPMVRTVLNPAQNAPLEAVATYAMATSQGGEYPDSDHGQLSTTVSCKEYEIQHLSTADQLLVHPIYPRVAPSHTRLRRNFALHKESHYQTSPLVSADSLKLTMILIQNES